MVLSPSLIRYFENLLYRYFVPYPVVVIEVELLMSFNYIKFRQYNI